MLIFEFFSEIVDSTHIHMTCKFARHYGKDCESEVHVNLDFRMPSMISEMGIVLVNINLSGNLLIFQDILERLTVYWHIHFHLVQED